ncbi:MAG: soxA [Planctomycetaceae bacterium]|nr:soxA [Planctomycetaceae bacterium]
MVQQFDAIVIGVGGFGSSALYHLAERGQRVLGLEQFGVAHDRGSSHGETRIIRQAYFEHVNYVPLLQRAYELWDRMSDFVGKTLFHRCGLMLSGPGESEVLAGTQRAADQYHLNVEELSLAAAAQRFPCYRFPDNFRVLFERNAGFLDVEDCVAGHIRMATAKGAVLRTQERVLNYVVEGDSVRVETDRETYLAGRLIVTAGPWASRILGELGVPLRVVRKPLFWFPAAEPQFQRAIGNPTFFFDLPEGQFYGFPALGSDVIKVAEHTGGDLVADPTHVDREFHASDLERLVPFLTAHLPQVVPRPRKHSVCMYTLSPDHHFVIDRHPEQPQVVFGAGFSGHGFKFTTVIGEALAELALDGVSRQPIEFLNLSRFQTETE